MFKEEWRAFSNRRLHLIHLNINILLPKIDELRDIAKRTKPAVIGMSESKLDSTVLDSQVYIDNYKILHFDRNRHGRRVACYIRSDIRYKLNSFLPNEIENITFGILMPHTKPITVGIIYSPQISLNVLIFLKKIYLNSTQAIVKFTSWVISTLIFLKTENMFSRNPPIITKT